MSRMYQTKIAPGWSILGERGWENWRLYMKEFSANGWAMKQYDVDIVEQLLWSKYPSENHLFYRSQFVEKYSALKC